MGFINFLILLIISVAVSTILHYHFKYYVTPGIWSFCSKVAVGWIGAWLGSPIFGHWPSRIPSLHYQDVWYIPAILGALALIIVAVDVATMATMRNGARRER
jgi:uncharacterized membrane protein YeaQ/YmgE (transglycosylase-associated protein family)